ncbi:MAG: hypothetical protein R3F34_20250 [Planctomycetota bacterium]
MRRLPTDQGGGWRDWRGHDAALLLTGSFRSALWALLSGARVRIGQARDGRSLLLTHAVAPALERGGVPLGCSRRSRWPRRLPRPVGAVAAELAALVGAPVADAAPRLAASDAARERVRERLRRADVAASFLLVNVGGRAGSAKALGAGPWAEVLASAEASRDVVLVFGPGESERAKAVAAALHPRRAVLALDERAPTLDEYVALLEPRRVVRDDRHGPAAPRARRRDAGRRPPRSHRPAPHERGPCDGAARARRGRLRAVPPRALSARGRARTSVPAERGAPSLRPW